MDSVWTSGTDVEGRQRNKRQGNGEGKIDELSPSGDWMGGKVKLGAICGIDKTAG